MDIKVGQKYKARNGDEFVITHKVDNPHFPMQSNRCHVHYSWTSNGEYLLNGARCSLDLVELIKEEEETQMQPYMSTNYLTRINDEQKNYVIVNTAGGTILGSETTLEEAKTTARKALKLDSEYLIFKAVCKVSPKPIDAEIEEL